MKVRNMTSEKTGQEIPNQFIIRVNAQDPHCEVAVAGRYFQSYDSMIAFIPDNYEGSTNKILLDKNYWNYSKTIGKYRNQFLGETKKETEKKIKSGEYILTNLN